MPSIQDRYDIATTAGDDEVAARLPEIQPLITEQQVVFGTAAATAPKDLRAPAKGGWVARLARRMAPSRTERPPRPHYPAQYGFIADARMDREMYRL
ncbi:MAG: hypothetical protein JOZ00_26015 [Mycobacterium sp.]|uniref:hypothetical protein n=1 Tax=Mycobacterium sp. TaxID=1785 RepID=UPI001EC2045E|nr:hypothetical protein [Mycobacterium sp.]MBV8790126.1 hypothetical protein [Mycobacterium sp.]